MSTSRTREKADGELFKSTGIDDNATSNAITIDSSEMVVIGATVQGAQNAVTISSAGYVQARATGVAGYFDRIGSDGSVLEVRKDGTAVGSIGSSNGAERLYMVNDSTGLSFLGDFSKILPCDSAGAPRDAAIDLGQGSGGRFKDLHLSGGVYLGGTGAANKLDDYEEGTWTPSITRSGISIGSYAIRYGSYTKIGNQVTLFCKVQSSNISSGSGGWSCTGLPFAPTGTNANTTVGRNYMDADTNDRDFRIAGNVAALMTTSADNPYTNNTTYVIWTFTSTFQVA
jgi:hypothetical protein